MSLIRLTDGQTEKIQIDEGIVVINLGLEKEKILGPTRGGAEFTATPSIRDIEFDGRKGKTEGMQLKDGEDVTLKVITLDCSQETLALAIPNAVVNATTKKVEQGDFGIIAKTQYIPKISIITKMLDGTFKILNMKNALHEGAFTFKTASKAENEHNLEMIGHYKYDNDEKIWDIEDSATNPIATGN